MVQQSQFWHISGEMIIQKIYSPQCSLKHYLQQPRYGSNLNICQQMDLDKEDVVYRHTVEYYLAIKRMK